MKSDRFFTIFHQTGYKTFFGLVWNDPNHSYLRCIRIYSDWKFGLDQSELGLIRIENLVSDWFGLIRIVISDEIRLGRIDFLPFFIKRETKRFSDWFGMIHIGSDTNIGIVLIDSEWIPIRYFRQGCTYSKDYHTIYTANGFPWNFLARFSWNLINRCFWSCFFYSLKNSKLKMAK